MWLECRGWVGRAAKAPGKHRQRPGKGIVGSSKFPSPLTGLLHAWGCPACFPALQLSGFLAVLSAVAGSHPTPTPTWFYNEEGSGHCWIPVRSCRSQ